jgi:hypothetical protein
MAASGSELLNDASATGSWVAWPGGRTSLVVYLGSSGALPTTLKLQALAKDNSTAIDVATIAAVGLSTYDLPKGKYRMSISGGSPAHINADLAHVSYNP